MIVLDSQCYMIIDARNIYLHTHIYSHIAGSMSKEENAGGIPDPRPALLFLGSIINEGGPPHLMDIPPC